jgi:hypothetical protein
MARLRDCHGGGRGRTMITTIASNDASPQLRSAAVALRKAEENEASEIAKAAAWDAEHSSNGAELDRIKAGLTRLYVSADPDERKREEPALEHKIAGYPDAARLLGMRVARAKMLCADARKAYRSAARAFTTEHHLNPARTRLAKTLDQLRDDLACLLAANYAVEAKFPLNEDGYDYGLDFKYGPASSLVRQLGNLKTWADFPYSLRPTWLDRNHSEAPWHWPGVDDALTEIVASVEDAVR